MTFCQSCLEPLAGPGVDERHHRRCLVALFGTETLPSLDVDIARLHTVGLAMVGRVSLSGVQRKISLGLDSERQTLRLEAGGRQFILKPPTETFPALPQNEFLTMRLASLAGIETPPLALIPLADGVWSYIVRRFDRPDSGGKIRQEDFCQLAGLPPKDKYRGSAELCVRLLKRYASEPGVELQKLYLQLVFGWWTGNGDLHLKNLSLVRGADHRQRLSPAYDLLSTALVIADDRQALPVGGRADRLTRRNWLDLAEYGGLPRRAAERVLAIPADILADALAYVSRSALPVDQKDTYEELLRVRAAGLATP